MGINRIDVGRDLIGDQWILLLDFKSLAVTRRRVGLMEVEKEVLVKLVRRLVIAMNTPSKNTFSNIGLLALGSTRLARK